MGTADAWTPANLHDGEMVDRRVAPVRRCPGRTGHWHGRIGRGSGRARACARSLASAMLIGAVGRVVLTVAGEASAQRLLPRGLRWRRQRQRMRRRRGPRRRRGLLGRAARGARTGASGRRRAARRRWRRALGPRTGGRARPLRGEGGAGGGGGGRTSRPFRAADAQRGWRRDGRRRGQAVGLRQEARRRKKSKRKNSRRRTTSPRSACHCPASRKLVRASDAHEARDGARAR